MKSKRTKPAKRTKARSSRAAARASTKSRAVDNLQERVNELEETLRAIRSGEVDAVVVSAPAGDQVFTLQGAEHPYRLLVETIDEGAATISNDGTILYSNRSFANILDRQPGGSIGLPIENFAAGHDVEH